MWKLSNFDEISKIQRYRFMQDTREKITVGISIGDLNGIGPEVALQAFEDSRMLDFCTPVFCIQQDHILPHESFRNLDEIPRDPRGL